MSKHPFNRRDFLKTCGKMSTLPVMSSLLQLNMTNSVLGALPTGSINDYKALVCVFLQGGNDSFNMLTPYGDSAFSDYQNIRGAVALGEEALLPAWDTRLGKYYGIHKSMPDVASMFENEELSFVSNVGTLVQPITVNQYFNGEFRPQKLFSHRHQQMSWQTSVPDRGVNSGWLGRTAEVLYESGANSGSVSMNMSLAGSNLIQAGEYTDSLKVGSGGASQLKHYSDNPHMQAMFETDLNATYSHLMQSHYNYVRKDLIEQGIAYNEARNGVTLQTVFPNTKLGNSLKEIAIAIKSRGALGHNRQTFFANRNGFDTHGNLLAEQNVLLAELNGALVAFNNAMKEIGVHDQVTTYTASDFGRSLTSNSSGTDHGWGGNQIVMGGSVDGRKVFGEYPSLVQGSSTDIGRGRQLPTISTDEFFSELALWYGIPNDNEHMQRILPNIRNFIPAGAGGPVGFMNV